MSHGRTDALLPAALAAAGIILALGLLAALLHEPSETGTPAARGTPSAAGSREAPVPPPFVTGAAPAASGAVEGLSPSAPNPVARPLGFPSWAAEVGPDTILGWVVDATGRPRAGARVRLIHGPDGPLPDEPARSAAEDGGFRFAAPAGSGDYALEAGAPGLATRIVPVRSGFPVRVVLGAGGGIAGETADADGRPVAGRIASLSEDGACEAAVGADGTFELRDVPPGLATVRFEPDPSSGGLPVVAEAVVEVSRTTRLHIVVARGRTIAGEVRLPSGGPAAGAEVRVYGPDAVPGTFRSVTADATGRFAAAGAAPGEATLLAVHPRGSCGPAVVFVPEGSDPSPAILVLGANPTVGGVVETSDGRPVAHAVTQLVPDSLGVSGGGAAIVESASDGTFAFGGVPAGAYLLTVRAPGFADHRETIAFGVGSAVADLAPDAAAPPRVRVVLDPGAAVHGEVRFADGRPVGRATIEAIGERRLRASSDENGRFDILGLSPGPVELRAHAEGTGTGHAAVDLRPGEGTTVAIVLPAAASVAGRVAARGGRPVAGASVRVVGPADDRVTFSDEAGWFGVGGLGEGPYLLDAHAPGFLPRTIDGVPAGAPIEVTLDASRILFGEVTGPDGLPIQRFVVEAAPAAPEAHGGGRFSLVLPADTREIVVRAPGLSPATVALPPAGETISVRLEAGGIARGCVLDAAGQPLAGAAVLRGAPLEEDLFGETAFTDLLAMTGPDGRFEVAGVPPGGLPTTISHPDHAPLRVTLTVGPEAAVRLAPGGRIAGRVAGPGPGGGLGDVPIVVEGPVLRRVVTGPDGSFEAGGLARGAYAVRRADTGASVSAAVEEGSTVRVDLP